MNQMNTIRIEKVVLNMGCGAKMSTQNAKTILEKITNKKSIIINTKKRSTFGVPRGKPIGVKVTLRKSYAKEILKRLLEAKEKKLKSGNFDRKGNFAFGVHEYIDVPDMEYDPKIGILGFDVCVTLERPGYRVKKRKIKNRIGKNHIISKEEAVEYVKKNFGVKVE